MNAVACLYAGLIGACIGSFLNVIIYRRPARQSVVRSGSACPRCGASIRWWHNVPVLAYVWLRGRCAACRHPIARSYVAVEATTALVFAGLAYGSGGVLDWLRLATLAAILIAAAEIDRRHGLVPNRLVGTAAVLGLMFLAASGPAVGAGRLVAACAMAGGLLAVRTGSRLVTGRVGLGMGDVKLAAVLGLYLGWASLWVVYLAMLLGGLIGLAGLLTHRLAWTTKLPFAPFLATAAGLHLLALPADLPVRLMEYLSVAFAHAEP